MPAAWRPKDYAEFEFRARRQQFRTPVRKDLPAELQPKGKSHVDDPGNLPGAVFSWLVANNVRVALTGSSADAVAKAIGISGSNLAKAMSGTIPFPIEYVAALAAHFAEDKIVPTAEDLAKSLALIKTPRGAQRRGHAYVPPGSGKVDAESGPNYEAWHRLGWDPATGERLVTPVEVATEWELKKSACSLVEAFFPPLEEGIAVSGKFRIAARPVPSNRKIQIETERPGGGGLAIVEVNGEVDPDWRETVHAKGLTVLDGHFVTRIVEPGENPRTPRTVEALFVFPDLNSRSCLPIGRPFVATVDWREDGDGKGLVPTLTPTLDGYAEELLDEVVTNGDPYEIRHLFPGQQGSGRERPPAAED